MTARPARSAGSDRGDLRCAHPGDALGNSISASGNVQGSIIQAGSIGALALTVQQADAAPPVPPSQLPPAPRTFVNRARELRVLDELTSAAGDAAPMIVVLNGLSGVGKTAVGLHWARISGSRFPGGQLHADLSLYRHRGAVAIGDVLAAFLNALGVHQHFIPAGLPGRAALFRSRTASRPVLVFIDDADQAAQVRPLIPGAAGSAVIVTSQNRLTGLAFDDARFVDLAPLTDDEGFTMLNSMLPERQRASLRRADVRDLLALCGGLPVAIRVAAARLAERRRWSPATLSAYLSNEDRRLARLSMGDNRMNHVFDSVVDSLSAQARRVYRCLGLHAGPEFGVGVAAAAARLTDDESIDALDELVEANLIEDVAPQRYRFHDLVRLHARGLAESRYDERQADGVAARIESWYLARVVAADLAVAGENRWRLRWSTAVPLPAAPFTAASAMQWCEAERANLLAAVRSAAHHHRDEVVLRFCEALWPFYHGRKHHADWIEAHQLGIAAAVGSTNCLAEARMRNQLARAYVELERFADAEAELARARQAAEATR